MLCGGCTVQAARQLPTKTPPHPHEKHKVLETCVEMRLLSKCAHLLEMTVIDVCIHTEQSFKDGAHDIHKVSRERFTKLTRKDARVINLCSGGGDHTSRVLRVWACVAAIESRTAKLCIARTLARARKNAFSAAAATVVAAVIHAHLLTCASIQSNNLSMYSGADSRTGFLYFTPSAQRYSYCTQASAAGLNEWARDPVTACDPQACMRLVPQALPVLPWHTYNAHNTHLAACRHDLAVTVSTKLHQRRIQHADCIVKVHGVDSKPLLDVFTRRQADCVK